MLPSTPIRTRRHVPLLLALVVGGCSGGGTLEEVRDSAGEENCEPDGGVCDVRSSEPDVVRVDCCARETSVVQQLCDDLYGGSVPEGLVVEDTCDTPPSDEDEDEDADEDDADPCAGLEGIEAIFCGVTSVFGESADPNGTDPCAGLESTDALLCQLGGLIGLDTAPEAPAEGPLADVVNGINALADIANGLNSLAQLLGLQELFGSLFGGEGMGEGGEGAENGEGGGE